MPSVSESVSIPLVGDCGLSISGVEAEAPCWGLSDGAVCASTAEPAHKTAATTVRPDILLSDVVMPGMTGIELAIRIRQTHSRCTVLLLSGQITTSDLLQQASREGHSFDILAKPFPPNDLLEKLGELA